MTKHYWPKINGLYEVEDVDGERSMFSFENGKWISLPIATDLLSERQMIADGYLGVRLPEKPTTLLADEAEAAFRACKKPYEFERWALAYGPKLIAAARGMG